MPNTSLKPFIFNANDLSFLLNNINFRPLFTSTGTAIINWNGVGPVYDGHGAQIWDGTVLTAAQALAQYGSSYTAVTSSIGLRDVTGLNNNLNLVNAQYGTVDQEFLRTVEADYTIDGHGHVYQGNETGAYWANGTFATQFGGAGGFTQPVGTSTDYTVTVDGNGVATMNDIVDYTPRMISLTITTGGVVFQQAPGGGIAHDPNGVAIVTDWGVLGDIGILDTQPRFAGSPGEGEYFIGAQNPGVSPTNGWFTLFGQFFDHGLDLISKNSGHTIKITFAADDPLYGMIGPDGRPATSITISRADTHGVDANGDPTYINHTSPFIDQSQTYGSHSDVTEFLREWVLDPATGTYHAGMNLFNGETLAEAWTRPDGTTTHETLPTLNELRAHVIATGRVDISWEDVSDFNGSGQALILDSNPRFDDVHLMKGDAAQDAAVNAAIASLDALVKLQFGATSTFEINATTHKLTLFMENLPVGTPPGTPQTLEGASALYPFVNFANFGITLPAGAEHNAVGTILMASVGDHYIAGDGRVNENFGLTSIHHVWHEEHNFQVGNLTAAISKEADARVGALGDGTFDQAYMAQWQSSDTATTHWDAATGNYRYNVTGNVLTDNVIAWDQDKVFNAAKLVVEMEYQHVAVDQYARTVTPDIKEFVGYTAGADPSVSLEYAQSIFRFGHSQLRETIDTIDPTHGLTGRITGYALEAAFLNPDKYADLGPAAIALGMTHQQGNEIDEFITPALNQGLLGQPLDLAAINIARGRDVGIPALNEFRVAIGLRAYDSWADYGANMIHPESLVNFIAAYSFDGDLTKAGAIIGLSDGSITEGDARSNGLHFRRGVRLFEW